MKKLILIRHAKSSWEYPLTDKERPLIKRGVADIKLVAQAFLKKHKVPNSVFSSPATRALTTCQLFLDSCGVSLERIQIKEQLYDFGGDQVLDFIKGLSSSENEVLIFGHNEALTVIANSYGNRYIDNLPTSGLVKIAFKGNDWNAITKGKTKLIIMPKELR